MRVDFSAIFQQSNIKGEKFGDEDNIVIENAHEPIVDGKTFAYTKEQLELRSKGNYRGEKKYATDYSGFMFCGDCGSPMFSMSRPDLSSSYTCGTYHKRGLKGCTSHHIRVDVLDRLLKEFILRVRDNCKGMIDELQKTIDEQPEREEQFGDVNNMRNNMITANRKAKTVIEVF